MEAKRPGEHWFRRAFLDFLWKGLWPKVSQP